MVKDKIELADGSVLWSDGVLQVAPDQVDRFISALGGAEKLAVFSMTPEIEEFNRFSDVKLTVKTTVNPHAPSWIFPDRYKYLDLDEYLIGLSSRVEQDELYEARLERLANEIALFRARGLDDVLRALIYVLDLFKANNVVWGLGRGSSCSSYLLHLIGLHEVDPVRYDIDITDFIR